MKSIKRPNHPAYHWRALWPLEVWVRGLYNSWWFCVHKLSMFIYLSMNSIIRIILLFFNLFTHSRLDFHAWPCTQNLVKIVGDICLYNLQNLNRIKINFGKHEKSFMYFDLNMLFDKWNQSSNLFNIFFKRCGFLKRKTRR